MNAEPFNPPRLTPEDARAAIASGCKPNPDLEARLSATFSVADRKPEPCCCKHCTPAWVHLVGILRARGEVFEAKRLEELLGVHR